MASPESSPEETDILQAQQQAFSALVSSLPPQRNRPAVTKFVKKLDGLQEVALPPTAPRLAALALAERGLIGQFTGLWPSPKTVQRWVERNWLDKTQGKIAIRFCGKGFFTFHFETKNDKDLIFRNGPYFMDSRGLYLNKWTPYFDPELDIPNAVPVWVRLPHLPLHCWGDDSVRAIGNAVGKYIDRSEPRDNMQACARICVEVDLGKGLPEAIKIKVDEWSHIQQLDYEQIPFKCKVCHEYGHFANRCTKIINVDSNTQDHQWEVVKKKKSAPSISLPNDSDPSSLNPSAHIPPPPPPSHPSHSPEPEIPPLSPSSTNPFHILSLPEDDPSPSIPTSSNPSAHPSSLPDQSSSPHMSAHLLSDPLPPRVTRSNSKDQGSSLDGQKKPGRKSTKQHRDENAQKDIALGLQHPIESFIQANKDQEAASKDKGGRAPSRNVGLK
jgi:hypothetical protein